MKMMKRCSIVLIALLLVCSLSVPVFAADSTVTYKGHDIFGFGPGSSFTKTDLFDNFKGVMSGDKLTETITVKNTASCCDFIKIYMRAEVHGDENALSRKVAKQETTASMQDFLSQLSMTIWNDGTKIYEAAPDELDELDENVLLGTFRQGEKTTLTVQLDVPTALGNEYANRVGEVDWVFVVEEYDDKNPDVPKTGDESHIVWYVLLMSVSMFGFCLILLKRKNKKAE